LRHSGTRSKPNTSLPEEEKRSEAEKYGLVYVYRKNELARRDLSPTLFGDEREDNR
jgi:hypothetical protein